MKLIWEAIKRTGALIAAEVAALMASGAILDIEVWKTAVQTGIAACLTVWGSLGRAYYTDGKLDRSELDQAFKR